MGWVRPGYWILENMVQIQGLSTVPQDQGIAPLTYFYLAPWHFPIHRTKASHLEPISVCSCRDTIFIETNKIKLEHYLQKNIVAFTFTFTSNSMARNCRYCCLGIFLKNHAIFEWKVEKVKTIHFKKWKFIEKNTHVMIDKINLRK